MKEDKLSTELLLQLISELQSFKKGQDDFRLEVSVTLATISEKVKTLTNAQTVFVTKDEFSQVKNIVFGLVGSVLLAIIGGIANFFFNK